MTHASSNTGKAGRALLVPLGFQKRFIIISLNQRLLANPFWYRMCNNLPAKLKGGRAVMQVPQLLCIASPLATKSFVAPEDEQVDLYNSDTKYINYV